MSDQLALTGERTVPGIARENYWFRRHLVVYEAPYEALPRCRGVVLEAGCGEGYGADLLAGGADAGAGARLRHAGDRARRAPLPAGGGGAGQPRRAAGARRAGSTPWCRCRSSSTSGTRGGSCASADGSWLPGGALLLSTPNRLTFSPGRDTPLNPFHTRELSAAELAELLVGARVRRRRGARPAPRAAAARPRRRPRRLAGRRPDRGGRWPGSAWPPALLRDVASVTTADFALHADDVDAPPRPRRLALPPLARVSPAIEHAEFADSHAPRARIRHRRGERGTHRALAVPSPTIRHDESDPYSSRARSRTRRGGNDDSPVAAVACRR